MKIRLRKIELDYLPANNQRPLQVKKFKEQFTMDNQRNRPSKP